ncbi:MAG: hypothetical protein IPN81_08975 [Nitrosomonadales bacterium]|nr:hypothetical protein [Nitrosomonadales bacterium]
MFSGRCRNTTGLLTAPLPGIPALPGNRPGRRPDPVLRFAGFAGGAVGLLSKQLAIGSI